MTEAGPRIIDWVGVVNAPAALDLARSHITLHELVHGPDDADPGPPQALNAALQRDYAALAGLTMDELTAAIAPYLPILRAFVLVEQISTAVRARLLRSVEASLGLA